MFYLVIASFYLLKLEFRMQIRVITRVFIRVITRLADSRVGEASHLYTTRLVTRLRLQNLLTRLVSEPRVGTPTRRSLVYTTELL